MIIKHIPELTGTTRFQGGDNRRIVLDAIKIVLRKGFHVDYVSRSKDNTVCP